MVFRPKDFDYFFRLLASTFRALACPMTHISAAGKLALLPNITCRLRSTSFVENETGVYVNRNSDEFKVPFLEEEGVLTVTEDGGTGASLTALPSFTGSDNIVITFTNVPSPTLDDWVGRSAPSRQTTLTIWTVSVTHLTRKRRKPLLQGKGSWHSRHQVREYRYFSKLSGVAIPKLRHQALWH